MSLLKEYQIKKVMKKEKIIKKLKLFDMSVYNEFFEDTIIKRGESYSKLEKVKNVELDGNIYKCLVEGDTLYNVTIKFNNNNLEEMSCTCPYYLEYNKNCKHIYACLYEINAKNNSYVLNNELKLHVDEFLEFYDNCDKYILKNYSDIEDEYKNQLFESIKGFYNTIVGYRSNLNTHYISDEETLFRINDTIEKYKILETAFDTMKYNQMEYERKLRERRLAIEKEEMQQNQHKSDLGLFKIIGFIGSLFLDDVSSDDSSKNYSGYTDKELKEDYYLEDWQIDLVKTGEYGPGNFEEDDEMEPEDYYYDEDEERRK